MKIPVGIEKVLYLAATDAGFREALFADRNGALARPGVNLSSDETAILKCIPDDRLRMMISQIDPAAHGKRFMQKVAACAVALAATTAGAGCKPSPVAGTAKDREVRQDAGVQVTSTHSQTNRPRACETESRTSLDLDAADFGSGLAKWGVNYAGILADRPGGDFVDINMYGDFGEGTIDQVALREVVRSCQGELKRCLQIPSFEGKDFFGYVDITLVLRRDGAPLEVLVTEDQVCEPLFTKCALEVFKAKQYPRPESAAARYNVNMFVSKVGHFDKDIEPTISLKTLDSEGVRREEIDLTLAWRRHVLMGCYRKALQQNRSLRGEATFRMLLDQTGVVSETTTLALPKGGEELARQIHPWLAREKFPKPVSIPASVTATFAFDCFPKLAMGIVSVKGKIDPDIVSRVVQSRLRSIKSCFKEELKRNPGLRGEIEVTFVIDEDGRTGTARLTRERLGSPAVADCVIAAVQQWRFPKPESGTVIARVPIVFSDGRVQVAPQREQ